MTKRAFPLLYIYQKKEAEVEPPSQDFVYTKHNQIEKEQNVSQGNRVAEQVMEEVQYDVDLSEMMQESLESTLKQQSREKKQVELKVADAVYVGTVSLEGDLVFCQVDPSSKERLTFAINEIQSAKVME